MSDCMIIKKHNLVVVDLFQFESVPAGEEDVS